MIIEAMKTMNHIPSTSDGEVKNILITKDERKCKQNPMRYA